MEANLIPQEREAISTGESSLKIKIYSKAPILDDGMGTVGRSYPNMMIIN